LPAAALYTLEPNQVPFFMVLGGQSFAQAFDAAAAQVRSCASRSVPGRLAQLLLAGA
jgi:hypothetical protein